MAHSDPNVNNPDGPPVAPSVPVAPQYQPEAGAATPVERPTSVTRAVQLMYVGAALSVLGIILAWTTRSQLTDVIATAGPTLSPDEVDAAVTLSLAVGTVIGLIGVILWLWMASANGAGKSWARVVATVLGALNVLSTVYTLSTSGTTGITTVTTLLSLVLAVVILVLLWLPASSAFFQARSAQRV